MRASVQINARYKEINRARVTCTSSVTQRDGPMVALASEDFFLTEDILDFDGLHWSNLR